MRGLLLVLLVLLLGCGPNRSVERGQVVVTAVETTPVKFPGKKE